MAVDFAHYEGREPAYVKHTFLDQYLPSLIGKVASRFDEFVYVDGFAGPWNSRAGETFDDTSFGIALKHMTAVRIRYLAKGRDVKMRAILVEKEEAPFRELQNILARFPKVEVIPIMGEFESQIDSILRLIPERAFLFSLIDPKGFPEIDKVLPLLSRQSSEALLNFMYDHANRFAATGLIGKLEGWLSVGGQQGWQAQVGGLSGAARESKIEELAVEGIKRAGKWVYAPVISVDKSTHDRTLYKLIYLTRHPTGIEVFRASEARALKAQASARTLTKDRQREIQTGMRNLFSGNDADVASDRSAQKLKEGEKAGLERALNGIQKAGVCGLTWERLWPQILAEVPISKSALGNLVNQSRKDGVIEAPGWPSEKHKLPSEQQVLRISNLDPTPIPR